jgi:hypothetical protein
MEELGLEIEMDQRDNRQEIRMGENKSIMKRFAQVSLVALLAYVGLLTPSVGQTGQSFSRATLSDLSFITGLWRADWDGGLGEEHWNAPSGDSMVGTFRFVKDGKGRFYELMLIEQTADGPVLRLRHFNAGLIGWEDKAQVYSYPLVEYRQGIAIFEKEDKKSRLTYSRTSRESLSVVLDEPSDGKPHSEKFNFRLVE